VNKKALEDAKKEISDDKENEGKISKKEKEKLKLESEKINYLEL
jgi:hypothetical protein